MRSRSERDRFGLRKLACAFRVRDHAGRESKAGASSRTPKGFAQAASWSAAVFSYRRNKTDLANFFLSLSENLFP